MTRRKKKRIWLSMLALIILLIPGAFLGWEFFKVKDIAISGNERFSYQELVELSGIELNENIWMIRFDQIRQRMAENPCIEVVSIDRQYPDKIAIVILEKKPAAAVLYLDAYMLLDHNGIIMEIVDEYDTGVCPKVRGVDASAFIIGEKLQTMPEQQTDFLLKVLNAMRGNKVNELVDEIDMTQPHQIQLHLREGYTVQLGQAVDLEDKMKWINGMLPVLRSEGYQSGIIDVTGSNGRFIIDDPNVSPNTAASPGPGASPDPSNTPETDPDT